MEGTTMASDPSSSSSSASTTSASASTTSRENTNTNTGREKKRRRREVKKIEERGNLFVTYSKRRKGLYSKARQLCDIAPGAQAAVIFFSPSGKVCAFGNPSVNAVVDRYLLLLSGQNNANPSDDHAVVAAASAAVESREEEEAEEEEEKAANNDNGDVVAAAAAAAGGSAAVESREEENEIEKLRGDNSEENMELEELVEYKARLEGLRYKVDVKLEEARRRDLTWIFFV